MKVLVTGCAGFVGSWICEKALDKGYEVIGIDNFGSGVNFTPSEVKFTNIDLNDNIFNIVKGADAVVHAAAYAELRHNWSDISERKRLFKNNEMATINLLEQISDIPIIFLSSASVYGSLSNKIGILTEQDACPQSIESPYAASKLSCEGYVAAWSYKRRVPWYCLRLVNQVGKRSHRGVIKDFYNMAIKNNHIHAADNGKQIKNWVNVEDTADAIISLLACKAPSGSYTVTSEERWSWMDIVRIMKDMYKEKYNNNEIPFKLSYEDRMAGAIGDPVNLYVSGEKLKPYYDCKRSVEQAVRDTLLDLGWTK